MSKQKGFAPILIIVLIALAVGGYLLYQNQQKSAPKPTPTLQQTTQPTSTNSVDTSSWKTYQSKNLNLSFKYPDRMQINEKQIDNYWYINISADIAGQLFIVPQGKYTDSLCASDKPLKPIKSSTGVISRNEKSIKSITKNSFLVKIGEKEVNGELTTFDGWGTAATLTCEPIHSQGYDFLFSYEPPYSTAETKQFFGQILATLKFLPNLPSVRQGENQTNEIVSWEKYSSECGFTITAPSNWNKGGLGCLELTAPDYDYHANLGPIGQGLSIWRNHIDPDRPSVIMSIDDLIHTYESPLTGLVKNKKEATFTGIKGTYWEHRSMISRKLSYDSNFSFMRNNDLYIITLGTKNPKLFEQILATLKFTN